jgi:tryptophan-rich sensory protein
MNHNPHFRWSYFWIPAITLCVAFLGSYFTSLGMDWYNTALILPSYTPPRWVFGPVWGAIYILTTVAAIMWYENAFRSVLFSTTAGLFLTNALLNVLWTFLFFTMHWIMLSFFECALLSIVTTALMVALIMQIGRYGFLLLPYVFWSSFATYLTWSIALLNS